VECHAKLVIESISVSSFTGQSLLVLHSHLYILWRAPSFWVVGWEVGNVFMYDIQLSFTLCF